ncbi:MAG: glycosyltransferase [Anaerolineales bacterium]
MWAFETLMVGLYSTSILLLAGYAAHMMVLFVAAVWHREPQPPTPLPTEWPPVLVQLPVFNERYVVERLIDAAVALDYPSDRLFIQVLDDSTDDTAALARARVTHHRARGVNITYLRRHRRVGFKAGALAAGLNAERRGEFVAVFDADFVPPADFLRRLVPDFLVDARLGMVQARWEHLNADQNPITRAQALAFDSYFTVEQVARSRAGWPLNFNGSAGVWRRACIEDAGGWQGDTLAEDFDLSYRAQLRSWRLDYRFEVSAPAEIPSTILAVKRQQFRWAKGSFQVLGKVAGQWLRAPLSPLSKVMGLLHLTGYLPHPLLVFSLLLSLPLVLLGERLPQWGGLGWLSLVLPLVILWGQMTLRRHWPHMLCYFPVMLLGVIGLAFNNTWAFVEAVLGRNSEFLRTPKNTRAIAYALTLDGTTWGELLLALYALATGLLAVEHLPALAPVLFLYALSFGGVALAGLWEVRASRRIQSLTPHP